MVNKVHPQGEPLRTSPVTRVRELTTSTRNLLKGYIWYSNRGIVIANGEWRILKSLFDQIKESMDALDRIIKAYNVITTGAQPLEKRSLSGEIQLLQRAALLIYGERVHAERDKNSLHDKLKKIASLLGKGGSHFLSADAGRKIFEKIDELSILETWVLQNDMRAQKKFLDLSAEIFDTIRSYYSLVNGLLENEL